MLKHGTGALHIDACRVDWLGAEDQAAAAAAAAAQRACHDAPGRERWDGSAGTYLDPAGSLAGWNAKSGLGRWPANVLTDGSTEVLEAFPSQAREAVRFFYCPKASRTEREFGMCGAATTKTYGAYGDGLGSVPKVNGDRPTGAANIHPTVKPIDLMAWLIRLVTPQGGLVLDPFLGSGSTGIAAVRHGFRFTGIEQSEDYFEIACQRISAAIKAESETPTIEREIARAVRAVQLSMFETPVTA